MFDSSIPPLPLCATLPEITCGAQLQIVCCKHATLFGWKNKLKTLISDYCVEFSPVLSWLFSFNQHHGSVRALRSRPVVFYWMCFQIKLNCFATLCLSPPVMTILGVFPLHITKKKKKRNDPSKNHSCSFSTCLRHMDCQNNHSSWFMIFFICTASDLLA